MEAFNSDVMFDYESFTITALRNTRPADLLTSFRPDSRSLAVLAFPNQSLQLGKCYQITNWESFIQNKPTREPLRHRSQWELIFSELPHTITTAILTEVTNDPHQ